MLSGARLSCTDLTGVISYSMAAVLTTSMSLRIILSVRGSLVSGGSFAVTSASNPSRSGGTTHVISASRRGDVATNPVLSLQQAPTAATYAVPLEGKEREWVAAEYDGKSSVGDKEGVFDTPRAPHDNGVKITVNTETDYGAFQAK